MKPARTVEKRLNVRMGQGEYARLQLLAARAGMTVSHYIRALVRREVERKAVAAVQEIARD